MFLKRPNQSEAGSKVQATRCKFLEINKGIHLSAVTCFQFQLPVYGLWFQYQVGVRLFTNGLSTIAY